MGSMSRRDVSPPPESDVTVAQMSLEKVRKVGQSHKGCISMPPVSSQLTEAQQPATTIGKPLNRSGAVQRDAMEEARNNAFQDSCSPWRNNGIP